MSSKSLMEIARDLHQVVKNSPDYDWSFGKFHKTIRQYFGELYEMDIMPSSEEIMIPDYNIETIETSLLKRLDERLYFNWFCEKVFNEPDGPLDMDDVEQGLDLLKTENTGLQDEDLLAAVNRQIKKEMFITIIEADAIIDDIKKEIMAESLAITDIEGIETLAAAKSFRKKISASLNKCHQDVMNPPK